jgi:osmotically inducible protein OsmC
MSVRTSSAVWNGTLREGNGIMEIGSGELSGSYTHASRFQDGEGTNPEELIGAALAGCFSMFLSSQLTNAGFPPSRIRTQALVHLERDDIGPVIPAIKLETTAQVPGVTEERFQALVQISKERCPVSRALAGPEISVEAVLSS